MRDQAETLYREHLALQTSHAALIKEKADVDAELAKMKATQAKAKEERRSGYGFGDIGEERW